MSKKSCCRGCFDKQYGKRAQSLLKSGSPRLNFHHFSLERKLCSKKSLLSKCQILGLLVKTLAFHEKYPVLNRDNLMKTIQMQLSEKKSFYQLFAAFLKSSLDFEHFERKDDLRRFCISEITDSENVVG